VSAGADAGVGRDVGICAVRAVAGAGIYVVRICMMHERMCICGFGR
jgi:hypothetical protein